MGLTSGTRLGPYEILALIGAGGMGEVYKARDTRLDRIVAIKVLPAHLADKPDLRERFEREARTIASLNHPHICTLYDIGRHDGIDFLVMEYLEGETLAMRLLKGPLPLEQVLQYAIEISDALDKAHRKGVTHRDIKPGNIMLIPQGGNGTKLLDFGLAKLKQAAAPASIPMSQLPTLKENPTIQGTLLGTLQYMSPEQVEGKIDEIDGRADIFAFGAVLHEMATGKRAFEGKSSASVLGAIMVSEPPPMSSLQPMTPPALERVVKRCLAKDRDERWQSAYDLWQELKWIAGGGSQVGMPAPVVASRKGPLSNLRVAWSVAAVILVAALAVGAFTYLRRAPADSQSVQFSVGPPEKATFSVAPMFLTISPDGSKLAFVADSSGKAQLWIRPLDSEAAQALAGTENPNQPFWSPDSRFLAFYADGKLKKIAVAGGPPQTLAEAPGNTQGTWSREGIILFTPTTPGTIHRVSAAGGAATPVTTLDASRKEDGHWWPQFLPDGNHFLFLALSTNPENNAIYAGSLDSPEKKLLLNAISSVVYVPQGYLLFNREGTLMAQPFDAERIELTGEAVPIAEEVQFNAVQGRTAFSVSENGVLAYRHGPSTGNLRLAWIDRAGKAVETFGAPGGYLGIDLSPDGKRIAVHRHDASGGDIWLFDSARRGTMLRFTFDASQDNSMPIWSPDGSRIAFGSLRDGKWGIYQKPANGTGREELLFESELLKTPMSWSPDGKFIVYWVNDPKTGSDQWVLPLTGDRKPVAILQTPFNENQPQISPDGKWIAYASNETGRAEIYVRPFPSGEGKWQISTNGGVLPRWRRDGRELFYLGAITLGKAISVRVNSAGPTFEYGDPSELFASGYFNLPHTGGNYHPFAVSPDGQRFLIPRLESTGGGETAAAPITVVLNWTAGLRK